MFERFAERASRVMCLAYEESGSRRSWLRDAPMVSVGPVSPLSGKALLAKRAFELARKEADGLGQHDVTTEHLLREFWGTSAGCVKPPDDWVLTEARWGICG